MTGNNQPATPLRPARSTRAMGWACAAIMLLPLAMRAEDPVVEDGEFITVPNPITSDVANHVKEQAERLRQRQGNRVITKIVFDFNPNGREAATPDFGPCYELAKYIRSLQQLTTVAYVHSKVSRHTVLPVLACNDLVMASTPETRIGDILPDPNSRPDYDVEVPAYAKIVGEAKKVLILKMMDARIVVLEGRKNNGIWYVDASKQAEAAAAGVVGIKPEPVVAAGRLALFTADEALRVSLCKLTNKDSAQQVAEAYGISAAGVRRDPLQGRNRVACRIEIKNRIDPPFRETIERRIRRVIADGANMIFLDFAECGGTDFETARKLADFLRDLHQGTDTQAPVMTVAFIPKEAPAAATFLALGCSEIVMARNATIGDFEGLFRPAVDGRRRGQAPLDANVEAVAASLRDLAEKQGIPPVLVAGMLDPQLEIFRARSLKGAMAETRYLTAQELEDDRKLPEPKWRDEGQIKFKGSLLKLDADQAKNSGVARYVVDTPEIREVYAKYGLSADKVRNARPDWLDAIAEFLRHRYVRMALVMIGIMCLILELKIPGVTAPGVISAVCFVLFFWSQSQLNGQIIILAILLFLLGLVLIGIEIFVLPGFGFVGVSGIVLVVAGLGLATLERMPQSSGEWLDFGGQVAQFGLGLVVALVGAIVFAHYLPHIPVANKLILLPPDERSESGEEPPALPGAEQAAALLGAMGTAATMLRPAGMARFGEQYVDVVTEGSFIPAGARVQVIEVEGNRIVVKEV